VLDQKIDAIRYRAALGPVTELIGRSHSPREALGLAETFLGDNASLFVTDVHPAFHEEVAYLWSTFPARVKNSSKYRQMINVLLRQVIDSAWYGTYPVHPSDAEIRADDSLVSFARSKEDFDVRFDYVQYHGHLVMRIPNSVRLRYRGVTNHPGRYTQGLTTTRCTRATAALLNQISDAVAYEIGSTKPLKIMVNSILRTVVYQHSLATWGYVAPRRSAHLAGYAADIEKGWYQRHDQRVGRSLEGILADLSERELIYAVDERTHWHICLNPAHIPSFESQFQRWARERS
jgi:hypothetical protein